VTLHLLAVYTFKADRFRSDRTTSNLAIVEPSNVEGDGDNHEGGEVDCTNNFDQALYCRVENPVNIAIQGSMDLVEVRSEVVLEFARGNNFEEEVIWCFHDSAKILFM